jgi:signal transduction histidine kinase
VSRRAAGTGALPAAGRWWRRRTGTAPGLSRWAWAADIALAVGLAVATWYTADNPVLPDDGAPWPDLAPAPGGPPPPPDVGTAAGAGDAGLWAPGDAPIVVLTLAAVCVLPLAVRRRFPLSAYVAVLALTATFHALYDTGVSPDATTVFTFAAVLLAGFSAALYSPYRNAALACLGAGVVVLAALYETNVPAIGPMYVPFFVLLAIALAANAIHGWKQRLRAAEAARLAAAEQAVQDERARIARELHDVVTHHVSVMVIQAGAARVALDAAPERARDSLRAIECSGREAMNELREVTGLLTLPGDRAPGAGSPVGDDVDGGDPDLAPQPGLDQLDALIDRIRAAGLPVQVTIAGDPVALTAGADLAAYRVVQEALTNAMKHAAGARVRVGVTYLPGEVAVDVRDTGGQRRPAADTGGGRGLVGLRERLSVHGGSLKAGPEPGGGFAVHARIPTATP